MTLPHFSVSYHKAHRPRRIGLRPSDPHNVQVAVDTEHHLIITHEVTNDGSDRAQLANIASQAKEVLGVDELEAVADRGYYSSEEILACDKAGIAITTSGIETRGRFASRTLSISATRMRIAVRLAKS